MIRIKKEWTYIDSTAFDITKVYLFYFIPILILQIEIEDKK